MWILLESAFILVVILFLLMEVIIPLLAGKKLFPSFRADEKEPETTKPTKKDVELDEMVEELKSKVEEEEKQTESEIKETETKLSEDKEKLDKVKDLKEKTKNL